MAIKKSFYPCPFCGNLNTRVKYAKQKDGCKYRHRICLKCQKTFNTMEIYKERLDKLQELQAIFRDLIDKFISNEAL